MTRVVFSDIAGTIVRGNPWDYVRQHPDFDAQQGRRERWRFLPVYLGWRLKLVSDTTFRDQWLHRMVGALRGLPRPKLQALFQDVIRNQMQSMQQTAVIERLQAHQAAGDKLVLVSGMFVEMGEVFADVVGADDVIGSRIAYANEHVSGQLDGPTCVGPRKVDYIQRYLNEKHPGVPLADCYAYADSFSDRSLIAAVGHGVVTYPEADMRAYAEAQGWEIMSS